MSQPTVNADDAFAQLTNVILALAHSQAATNPEHTLARLGAAVIASREQGCGDYFPSQIFKTVFPGKPLPTVLSDADFASLAAKARKPG